MHGLGIFLTAGAFVCLSSSGWTASHYAITDSSALSVLSARYVVVVALLLILVTVLRKWQRISRREVAFHLLIGALCHALYLLGSMRALELGVSAAVIACINAFQPIASASLASVISRERIRKRYCIGFLLGVLSVVVVITDSYFQSEFSTLVLALPFSTMLALSLGLVLSRRHETQVRDTQLNRQPIILILLLNTVGAVILIVPLAAVSGELQWHFTRAEWSTIAWLSVVVSLGSYVLLLLLLRHNSAVRVSSLTYLAPPATLLQSYFLFGEALSLSDVSALCIASVAVYVILSKSSSKLVQENDLASSAGLAKRRLSEDSQQHATMSTCVVHCSK